MYKTNTEDTARKLATEHNLRYGWSIFSAGWYVGTLEQLTAIGVLDPMVPAS